MNERINLEGPGNALLTILGGVKDEHLDRPTPYRDHTVGEVLQHLVTVTRILRDTAEKKFGAPTEAKVHGQDWTTVEDGWRTALEEQVPQLVQAWREKDAWEGTTRGGGLDMKSEAAGRITLDELVSHGWDLARATGQDYPLDMIDEQIYAECREFIAAVEEEEEAEPIDVADNASVFERMLGLAGRDPQWSPS